MNQNKNSNTLILVILILIVIVLAGFVIYRNLKTTTGSAETTILPSSETNPTVTSTSNNQPAYTGSNPNTQLQTVSGNKVDIDNDLKSLDSLDPSNADKNYQDSSLNDL